MWIGRVIWAIVLAVFLTACNSATATEPGVVPIPTRQLIGKAIEVELNRTQQELRRQLRLGETPAEIMIRRVTIAEQTPTTIEDLEAYHVKGTYDYRMVFSSDRQVTQQRNPYDLYLQKQAEGKTWRLAHLQIDEDGEPVWVTERITF